MLGYSSKGCRNSLTRSLGKDLAHQGQLVNCITAGGRSESNLTRLAVKPGVTKEVEIPMGAWE